jgi:hypothetical protein
MLARLALTGVSFLGRSMSLVTLVRETVFLGSFFADSSSLSLSLSSSTNGPPVFCTTGVVLELAVDGSIGAR